jgi:hypothetical protein
MSVPSFRSMLQRCSGQLFLVLLMKSLLTELF